MVVGRPDVRGRLEILNVHAAKKPLGDDVDLESLARTTAGFTGADLENILNEAAINAAKSKRKFITNADVNYAFVKVGIGVEKRSKIISEKEKKITAYHESGHAILFHVLLMSDLYTLSLLFQLEWEQRVTQCRFLRRMRCLIPRARCYRILL